MRRKVLDRSLWSAQGILGSVFTAIGAFKLLGSMPTLTRAFQWPGELGTRMTRTIGATELAGGIGVVAPAATRIAPVLTPVAAVGLDTVMLLAAAYHLRKKEYGHALLPVALGALAAFVAWGRFKAIRR